MAGAAAAGAVACPHAGGLWNEGVWTAEDYRVRRGIVQEIQEMMRNYEQAGAVEWIEDWAMNSPDAPADLEPVKSQLRDFFLRRRGGEGYIRVAGFPYPAPMPPPPRLYLAPGSTIPQILEHARGFYLHDGPPHLYAMFAFTVGNGGLCSDLAYQAYLSDRYQSRRYLQTYEHSWSVCPDECDNHLNPHGDAEHGYEDEEDWEEQ